MILKKKQKNKGFMSGFTLIELMVATTIFTIVMLMGVGSLVTSSNAAKSAQKLQIAVDNVNFAMESMTRELRMGIYYECGSSIHTTVNMNSNSVYDCSSGGGVIAFTPQKIAGAPGRVGYYGNNKTLVRCVDSSSNCTPIVASNVEVQDLKFYVTGSGISDTIQPSVRIIMKGIVNVGVGTPFVLQTMASQRSAEK